MADDRRAQWLRGVLDLCVLAELERGESYGYGVARAFRAAVYENFPDRLEFVRDH